MITCINQTHMHLYTCRYTYTHTHARTHNNTHTITNTHTHTHTHTHTRMQTHTHTHTHPLHLFRLSLCPVTSIGSSPHRTPLNQSLIARWTKHSPETAQFTAGLLRPGRGRNGAKKSCHTTKLSFSTRTRLLKSLKELHRSKKKAAHFRCVC